MQKLRLMRAVFITAVFCGLLSTMTACNESQNPPLDRITVLQGAEQCTLPGETFQLPLRVELLGPQTPGLLGGKGSRSPVAGEKVRFLPAEGSDLTVEPAAAESDAGGVVTATVTSGNQTGDQYLKIIPETNPEKALTVRFIVGMKITGGDSENRAGSLAAAPLSVQLVKNDGTPAVGVPVYFRMLSTVEGSSSKAQLLTPETSTNAEGIASTKIKMGEKTGAYRIGVEVSDPGQGFVVRGKEVKLFGKNFTAVIISVLGGLALFVFGMKLMGDGILKVAGENMRKLLQFFARNGIIAVLAGTLVTAVIQSSSATTVMVIGFINAGLLSLSQAIGIIFGANIGTTVTAQIISFNLSGLALPAITVGFLVTLSKKRITQGWGETILGFGLLFFGMTIMSDELKVLGELPSFINFFKMFDCAPAAGSVWMPFGAVLGAIFIGLTATVVIQSSSAAMGIVLALAGSGLVNFYTAIPLLIGTNIGTTITAMLAAAAANRVAKQAALAHTLFNVFGALVMLVLFYVPYGENNIPVFLYFINSITPGDVFAAVPQNIERHIAMAHTFFNVTVVVLLLPFIAQFANLCSFLLPIPQDSKVKIKLLEPNLLATPSIALKQSVSAIRIMVEESWQMVDAAVNRHFLSANDNEAQYEELAKAEEHIDEMQKKVTDYLVKITRQELTEPQSALVPLLMHCTNDAERIADHTEVILQLTSRLLKSEKRMSEAGRKDLKKVWEVLDDQAHNVIAALGSDSAAEIKFALKDERKINKLADKFEQSHIERLCKGNCTPNNGIIFIEMLGELAKIGDRLSNIAERAPEIQKHYVEL